MTKEQESKMNDYYLELKEKGLLTTLSEANIFKLSYMQAFSLQGVSQQRKLLIAELNKTDLEYIHQQGCTDILAEDLLRAINCG
tara:strand:- start:325 stop:576 length:252 start_codon:yes stop_codon:yes gene_type:complete